MRATSGWRCPIYFRVAFQRTRAKLARRRQRPPFALVGRAEARVGVRRWAKAHRCDRVGPCRGGASAGRNSTSTRPDILVHLVGRLVGTGNWLGSLTPTSTDDAYIANGGTATITISDSAAVCNTLWLGDPNSANSGTIQMNNGSLTSGTDQNVGNLGTGTFLQSGGTNNGANNLNLGNNPGSLGIYSLSNSGMLNVANSENLGVSGTGTFTQLGGVNNAAGLTLGSNSGSIGTYTLSSTGTLNVTNSEYLGLSGTGTFNQLGGVNNAAGLTLCANSGSIGTYTLSGTGVLNATNQEFVGLSGTGTFIQSGGTNNANLGFNLASTRAPAAATASAARGCSTCPWRLSSWATPSSLVRARSPSPAGRTTGR